MKREGRQRGMVRSYPILPTPLDPRPETSFINRFDSPPTAGLFTKVSGKPTNHSKFTGKCGQSKCSGCHLHPVCKSKDKAKGTRKLRSYDATSNYRLVTWRVVDSKPGLRFSVNGISDHMGSSDYMDHVDDEDDYYMDQDDDGVDEDCVNESGDVEIKNGDGDGDHNHNTSFCDVGLWWEQVEGDEGWCLVGDNVIA